MNTEKSRGRLMADTMRIVLWIQGRRAPFSGAIFRKALGLGECTAQRWLAVAESMMLIDRTEAPVHVRGSRSQRAFWWVRAQVAEPSADKG